MKTPSSTPKRPAKGLQRAEIRITARRMGALSKTLPKIILGKENRKYYFQQIDQKLTAQGMPTTLREKKKFAAQLAMKLMYSPGWRAWLKDRTYKIFGKSLNDLVKQHLQDQEKSKKKCQGSGFPLSNLEPPSQTNNPLAPPAAGDLAVTTPTRASAEPQEEMNKDPAPEDGASEEEVPTAPCTPVRCEARKRLFPEDEDEEGSENSEKRKKRRTEEVDIASEIREIFGIGRKTKTEKNPARKEEEEEVPPNTPEGGQRSPGLNGQWMDYRTPPKRTPQKTKTPEATNKQRSPTIADLYSSEDEVGGWSPTSSYGRPLSPTDYSPRQPKEDEDTVESRREAKRKGDKLIRKASREEASSILCYLVLARRNIMLCAARTENICNLDLKAKLERLMQDTEEVLYQARRKASSESDEECC